VPIYNLQQLRDSAPPEFRDLSSEDLVREYSRSTGMPVNQALDFFGVAPRGTLSEMGRQLVGGAVVDLPKMVGQGLEYTGIAPEYGREMAQAAEARAPAYEPDMRGRGLVGQAGVLGSRAIAPMAPAVAASFLPGGQVAAPVVAAGLFGTSSAQETYDKLREQGVPEEDALAAARRVGFTQGPLEGLATAVGLRAARPAAAVLGIGEKTTAGVAAGMTDTGILKPFAKGMATNMVVQPATEVAQDVSSSLIERAYGAKPEDLGEIAKQSALGGAGLTAILGPLAFGGSVSRARNAARLREALDPNSDVDPQFRATALDAVMEEARRQGVKADNIDKWFDQQLQVEDMRTELLRMEEDRRKQQLATAAEVDMLSGAGITRGEEPLQGSIDRRLGLTRQPTAQDTDAYQQDLEQMYAQPSGMYTRDMTTRLPRELSAGELLEMKAMGQETDLLTGEQAGRPVSAPLTPLQQMALAGPNAPRPISGMLSPLQQQALIGPRQEGLTPMQQATLAGPTVVPQPITGGAAALTEGQRTALMGPDTAPRAVQGRLTKGQRTALAGPDLKPSPPPGVSGAVSPAAPVAAGASLKAPKRGPKTPQAKQTKAQGQELAAGEEARLGKLLEDIDNEDIGDVLPASVKSNKNAVPGRTSIGQDGLKRVRDALVKGKEAADEKSARIVDALKNFTAAYKKYSDQGGQAVSRRNKIAKKTSAAQFAENQTLEVELRASEVRQALAELGDAVGGNAKDVEAVVRLVKDLIQSKVVSPGKAKPETVADIKQLDTMLSQAWGAAKREVFMGERADTADIRPEPIRGSLELKGKGKVPTLVKVATEGRVIEDGRRVTGLPAILHYLRKHGTPMERALAVALRETLVGQAGGLKLEFITQGKPRFDPKTNTVYLNREESPEVILHEAFHAALQSFVYKNPNHPAVVQLKKSLKEVVGYKGQLTGKALEVQNLLKGLVKQGNELDAVLELVSYGNTLAEFRNALRAMQGDKTIPPSFMNSVNKAWAAIKQIASRLLGGRASLASDVLQSSLELLDAARTKTPVAGQGNVLEASVQSNQPAATQQIESVREALATSMNNLAKDAGYSNYAAYKDRPSTGFNVTRMLLEEVGFGKGGKISNALESAAAKSAAVIRKDFPALEAVILNLNSRFGQTKLYKTLADFFKQDAQTGLLEAEYMTQYMYRNPKDAEKIIKYLDEDANALTDEGRDATLRRMADNILRHISDYISTLPVKDRRLFEGMKFSDYLLNPQSIAQLSGKSLGIRSLSKKLGVETRVETTIDEFKEYLPFKEGSLDQDAGLYQIMETLPDNNGNMIRVPRGFIGKDIANDNQGLDIDRTRVWYLDKVSDNKFEFSTRKASDVNLRDVSGKLARGEYDAVEQEEAIQQISSALINTMAALSHNYAATNFFNGITKIGLDESGAPTAQSVVFDSVEQINEVFGGRTITEANVLQAPSEEAKTMELRAETQRSGTWVRMPDTDMYGAMRGKIIPGTVWNNILDMNDRSPLLNSKLLSDLMTSFKKAKTVLTPATHTNNILTNYALMLLHGIPHKALQGAAQLMYKYEVSPKLLNKDELRMMQEFYRSGAVLGQFTNVEAKKFITKKLAENIRPENDKSLIQKLTAWAGFERDSEQYMAQAARAGRLTDNFFTEVYAAGDNVFRLAAFLNSAGNVQAANGGTALTDAQLRDVGLNARKLFLDYDIDSRWVRAARQSFLPFVSWPYAIAPVLGRLAIEKPWTIVNMMAALGIMAAMTDGDDEWREKGPEQIRDTFLGVPSYFRVPFMGDDENPVYYNVGKSIPFMSLFQPPVGQVRLAGQDWIPAALTPGGPYTSLISALFFGTDAFTGKELTDVSDSQLNKLLKTAESVYNTMAPSVASTRFIGPNEGEIAKLLQNRAGPTGVEPDALFLARTLGGLSLYEFNRSEVQYYQDGEVKKLKREFGTIMNKAKKDEYAKGTPDYEALDAELSVLREKLDKRIREIRGEKE